MEWYTLCPEGHPPSGKPLHDILKEIMDDYITCMDALTKAESTKLLIRAA